MGVLLLVEDDDDQAFLLRRVMREQFSGGLEIVRVGTLKAALEAVEDREVRCVMLDLSLPDASGMEALEALRGAAPELAVVVLTGTDNDDLGRQALALGAQDFLVKGQHGPDVVRRSVVFSLERAQRQSAELARAELTQRLELVLETSAEGICTLDGAGAFNFVNRTTTELFSLPAAELIGQQLHDFHICPSAPCPLQVQLESGEVVDAGEQVFRSSTGRIVLEVRTRPVQESSTGIGAVVSLNDVTSRRRAQEALVEREAQLVEAQQLARLGSWEWVPAENELLWSDEMFRLTGLTTQEVPRDSRAFEAYADLVPEEERSELGLLFAGWTRDRAPVEVVHQLVRPDGAIRWMLCRASVREVVGPDATDAMLRVVGSVQDITEQKLSEEVLAFQAMHDGLTGLPNRALLLDRLERVLGDSRRDMVALVYMDIDGFKWVNDNLSHAAGDELLIGVADRLNALIRPSDTLARNGGDEFIMVCDGFVEVDTVTVIVDRLLESLKEPFAVAGRDLVVSMSMGLVVAPAGELTDAESLIRNADVAMYRAKGAGGGRCEIFDEEMRELAARKVQVQADLARALTEDEIRPWYQPLVDLATGRVVGCEALARWHHPDRGLLLPADFLPGAAETDAIVVLDAAILGEGCRQVVEWNDARSATEALQLAVNVSARWLRSDRLVEDVASALAASGLPGHLLCLEMTESVIMEDIDLSSQTLKELRGLGVWTALDNFGTGSSSLAHLSQLPVDMLKIDRSFVRTLDDPSGPRTAIVRAVEAVGHALGMVMVAEGVETDDEHRQVRTIGIDRAQGFLFGAATPADASEWAGVPLNARTGGQG